MLRPQTVIPAIVTVLAKRVARPVDHANERILTVSVGDHEWDVYVPEDEFEDAMSEVVKNAVAHLEAAKSGD